MTELTQKWQAARTLLTTERLPLTHLRTALLLAALAGTTVLVMYLGAHEAGRRVVREEAAQMRPQLNLYAGALEGLIEQYRALPAVLALDPELRTGTIRIVRQGAIEMPECSTGQNAIVFPVRCDGRTWAVRCFTNPVRVPEASSSGDPLSVLPGIEAARNHS